ncbi:MAG: PQQ-binding-like beta-propeller repeat protein [Verrucomicrobiales bacterium]|nr:PQQ-binding-like beta-propeller repeat protein [Verrucomicrobiales bacterium]
MLVMSRVLLVIGLSLSFAGFRARAADSDWPEFRGPTGQGHAGARRLPLTWSSTSNVVWKTAIPGQGWSSPVVVGNRVYLTTAVPDDGGSGRSLRALCLDATTGALIWNQEVFHPEGAGPGIHGKNSHASPTPLVRDGKVYVHFGHQGTAALDSDGRILWRQTSLSYTPVHGNGCSPIWAEGSLVFTCDGGSDPFVAALDPATGAVRWKSPRVTPAQKKFSFCTPLVITNGSRVELISPGSGAVCAYDPRDGRELWRVRYGEGYSVVPRPVTGHGLVFFGTGYDRPLVYAVRPEGASGDATESAVAWTTTRGAPNTPSMVLVGDELYFVSDGGMASCVDARTGTLHWNERLGGGFSASPIDAGDRIYFINEEGMAFVVSVGKQFQVLAKNDLGERTLASPAAIDGALFIRTEGHLYRIGESGTADKR